MACSDIVPSNPPVQELGNVVLLVREHHAGNVDLHRLEQANGSLHALAPRVVHAQSEQRLVRFFDLGEDKYALLISHPDCDENWLRQITGAGVGDLARQETLARIESRHYQWFCGCTQQKILGALAPLARADMQDLFGGSETIHVQCPRCAAKHSLTREVMEAFLAETGKSGQ